MSQGTCLKVLAAITALVLFNSQPTYAQSKEGIQLQTASHSVMKYYLSLPDGWTRKKQWPILVSCEAAEKEFKKNAERFSAARKKLPFIIVVPVITTNGNAGQHDPKVYPYSRADWKVIDKLGTCVFDQEGLLNVIRDVQDQYAGAEKVYLTGFEAGTHLVWATTFQHPELLKAVAVVGGNYIGRCMSGSFSTDPSREKLPIHSFIGEKDDFFGKKGKLYYQYENARQQALSHGFSNITETEVKGKEHEPLPEDVVGYFQGFVGR